MKKYKVVLLGGSNSVIINGFQKGLRQDNIELINLSLGATSSIQNLYETIRNKDILFSSDLIITESNINDIYEVYSKCSSGNINIIFRDLNWLYEELSVFNKCVMVLILPYFIGEYNKINNINRELVSKFNFNLIDLHQYYIDNNLIDFSKNPDNAHQLEHIMEKLGKNIANNISKIKLIKNNTYKKTNPEFKIIDASTINQMFDLNKDLNLYKNSVFKENTLRIQKEESLLLNNNYANYNLIGIHSWNFKVPFKEGRLNISKILLDNKDNKIIKELASYNVFTEVFNKFELKKGTEIKIVVNEDTTEFSYVALSENKECKVLEYCDLVGFLIASKEGEYYNDNFTLREDKIEVDRELLYNFLIPDIKWVSDCINEYNLKMDPRKIKHYNDEILKLQHLINNKNHVSDQYELELNKVKQENSAQLIELNILKEEINFFKRYGSAQDIIKNHLSYKIGNIIIKSKKRLISMLFLPFILLIVSISHKFTKKDRFHINLKDYPDYQEYLKIKNFYSYRLGELFIKHSKMYFGGGLLLFPYKAYKLYVNYKKKKK